MTYIGRVLLLLGSNGPILLVASIAVGMSSDFIAHSARAGVPVSAFLLTLGSFLTAFLSPPDDTVSLRRSAICLAWTGLGLPGLACLVLSRLSLDPALEFGILLSIVAPPIGSAAAIAALLGLKPRLALTSSIVLTLLAPATMPLLALLFGVSLHFDVWALATRLLAIVAAAACVAGLARRYRGHLSGVLPSAQAAAGVAVIGLMIVGLATSDGVRAHWQQDGAGFLEILAAAFAVNMAACALGSALFAGWGLRSALTVGLVSGNRNVTLAWAAAASALPGSAEAYVAASVIPVLALPLMVKVGVGLLAQQHFQQGLRWVRLRT